jgi:hypothetical protein
MKKIGILLFLISVLIPVRSQELSETTVVNAMHSISSHDLLKYVEIQCDERYQGRLTGTAGYQACAEWLADEFSEWGIAPAGEKGGWFQWFKVPYTMVLPDCGVTIHIPLKNGGNIMKSYKYVTEFMPGSTSGNGEITAEVVYAGYGITAPELGYDDYKGIDVKGKIIIIERESPVNPSAGAEKFNPWYEYSFHQYKHANAIKHGAIGMLYNYGPILIVKISFMSM